MQDPKDMLVSMWHFARQVQPDLPLAKLFEAACDGSCLSGPIWDHVLGY
jgi:hydroxyjasmonate sulfotransferase